MLLGKADFEKTMVLRPGFNPAGPATGVGPAVTCLPNTSGAASARGIV